MIRVNLGDVTLHEVSQPWRANPTRVHSREGPGLVRLGSRASRARGREVGHVLSGCGFSWTRRVGPGLRRTAWCPQHGAEHLTLAERGACVLTENKTKRRKDTLGVMGMPSTWPQRGCPGARLCPNSPTCTHEEASAYQLHINTAVKKI